MRTLTLFASSLLLSVVTLAQVPRNVLVEHFTNTRCGICANRNPGFFANLNNYPDVIHLAIHPSSPYSSCLLNQHNTAENDARTNFYGIYGGTPRLVIQGEVVGVATNYGDSSLFETQEGMMSNFGISIEQSLNASQDSVNISVTVKREGTGALSNALLFVALAEAELMYAAPNGENEHFNVFRESLFGEAGMSIALPVGVGEETTNTATVAIHPDWNLDELFSLAVLQDEISNEVLQVVSAKGEPFPVIAGINNGVEQNDLQIFPNPFTDVLSIEGLRDNQLVQVFDLLGQQVYDSLDGNQNKDLSALPNGPYVLVVSSDQESKSFRIVKQ